MNTPFGERLVAPKEGQKNQSRGSGNPPRSETAGLRFEVMEKTLGARPSYALILARIAADVANYCDHVEHNEEVSRGWVLGAASDLRQLAIRVASAESVDLLASYGSRLLAIEVRNVMNSADSFDGRVAVQQAHTWRDLQLVQIQHDRFFHPDVLGLHKLDQLRHYSLHLSKLAGAFARWAMDEKVDDEIANRRLPDMLLFGIKLSSVMGEKLPEDHLPGRHVSSDARRGSSTITSSGL